MTRTALAAEVMTAGFGISGALLLASAVSPGLGFAFFLASNLAGLWFATLGRYWALLVKQAIFMATSLLGLWVWWLRPLLEQSNG